MVEPTWPLQYADHILIPARSFPLLCRACQPRRHPRHLADHRRRTGRGKVEITKCGDMCCGKIVWLKAQDESDTPVTAQKNKADDLKDRPLVGLEVLQGIQFDGKDTWRDGEFYAYRKGKTVSPKLILVDENHPKTQVKILFVKKNFVWERVTEQ